MSAFTSLRSVVLGLFLCGLFSQQLQAHEYWISPETYRPEQDQPVRAQRLVGSNMQGEAFPWLRRSVKAARFWSPSGDVEITAREGDIPALTVTPREPGLHRISFHTTPSYITFDGMEKFASYLNYEGLQPVIAQHAARGLPTENIAEEYIRNARALIQVGPAQPDQLDAPTGMPFELVALQNPYVTGTQAIDVRLTWLDAPSPATQVAVFVRAPGATDASGVTRTLAFTDENGIAHIPLDLPGEYMLAAVHMDPVDGSNTVVWRSHWASLTFSVDG